MSPLPLPWLLSSRLVGLLLLLALPVPSGSECVEARSLSAMVACADHTVVAQVVAVSAALSPSAAASPSLPTLHLAVLAGFSSCLPPQLEVQLASELVAAPLNGSYVVAFVQEEVAQDATVAVPYTLTQFSLPLVQSLALIELGLLNPLSTDATNAPASAVLGVINCYASNGMFGFGRRTSGLISTHEFCAPPPPIAAPSTVPSVPPSNSSLPAGSSPVPAPAPVGAALLGPPCFCATTRDQCDFAYSGGLILSGTRPLAALLNLEFTALFLQALEDNAVTPSAAWVLTIVDSSDLRVNLTHFSHEYPPRYPYFVNATVSLLVNNSVDLASFTELLGAHFCKAFQDLASEFFLSSLRDPPACTLVSVATAPQTPNAAATQLVCALTATFTSSQSTPAASHSSGFGVITIIIVVAALIAISFFGSALGMIVMYLRETRRLRQLEEETARKLASKQISQKEESIQF